MSGLLGGLIFPGLVGLPSWLFRVTLRPATPPKEAGTLRIGSIAGEVNAATDSIQGTIEAIWISQEVYVECHAWGAPGDAPNKQDAVVPDGVEVYACSWDPATEWDVRPQQNIGVAYRAPEGHWVYNVFTAPWEVYLPLSLRNQ